MNILGIGIPFKAKLLGEVHSPSVKFFACHNLIESVQTAAEKDTRCHGTFPSSRNTGPETPGDESVGSIAFHSRALRDIPKDV